MEWIIATSILWGCTTPFIRRGAAGVESVRHRGKIAELIFLATSWRYILPLGLNLCGSLAFVKALQSADLAMASPLINSLALALTWLTGCALGENIMSSRALAAVTLVGFGSLLCATSG
ncbi:hypothetical protein BCR44DRAFT_61075 [Catenaria anguillulae PL171]|uniref:Transmembrane protein n=1 Tax=Catenaria anguillulae PL171 TaxID=765915 RepID=A0A1Y2HPD5_9FUNG|nr:hypothetical protein BCR44DRAFT_61075 [Catenaria anguillulae PL171]